MTGMINLRWTSAAIATVVLIAGSAGATYLVTKSGGQAAAVPQRDATFSLPGPGDAAGDVIVPLSQEAAERAGIRTTTVTTGKSGATLTVPAVVDVNAYRQTAVTVLAGGRITRVLVELGAHVQSGQAMAQVFSPELVEARARYASARAELDAHERELQRTQKLVEIGAASRQELERIHATHTAQQAMVQSAESRLKLLGGTLPEGMPSPNTEDGTIVVRAPIDGVVTERLANAGLNVDPATKLFTVADLSSVWIVADLYEKDFSRVRVGTPATITTSAYPDLVLNGQVSYIDPQVSPATRTGKIRVQVGNDKNSLRPGMYADMALGPRESDDRILIPRSAIQTIGDREVVYLVNADQNGTFRERQVRLGAPAGYVIEVLSGLKPGDVVVAGGSFYVRAERERLGLHPPPTSDVRPDTSREHGRGELQTARVTVGDQGFQPSRITLRAGIPAQVTFLRTSDTTCAKEIVVPSMKIRRALPLNEPVVIEFTPKDTGEIAFACGMNMLHGTIVVH
jgi:cobalt-zinc-cadmium efflux system membrane fusion protein